MRTRFLWLLSLSALACGAQEKHYPTVDIHGTVRAKYEYQPSESKGRFEVRNARFSLSGNAVPRVSYKAEIDLSDEGKVKMLDAYGRITPFTGFQVTIGQMRVPFTIDAHRSPHQQYFANRSFIAKQAGNVRDVGATLCYTFAGAAPLVLEAGMFNGSGLTNQKDFWTDRVNFSAKVQWFLPQGAAIVLSTQKVRPEHVSVMMYDAGAYIQRGGWHVEAEYLYKHYAGRAFAPVHSVDAFVSYDIPLRRPENIIRQITPLVRYDYLTDHSDGTSDAEGRLKLTDYRRSRITGGVTLSLGKAFVSDIRLNYEKYFYRSGAQPKVSERDKLVCELMIRF